MSGNFGDFSRWRIERDGDELVATSPNGVITLRGKDMADLEAQHIQGYATDLAVIRQALANTDPSGYPKVPPP